MERRYHEVVVDRPELPPRKKQLHVVTFGDEDPIERAVREGLLKPENKAFAHSREISREECFKRWQQAKFLSQQ
jgi:hypothetical protein